MPLGKLDGVLMSCGPSALPRAYLPLETDHQIGQCLHPPHFRQISWLQFFFCYKWNTSWNLYYSDSYDRISCLYSVANMQTISAVFPDSFLAFSQLTYTILAHSVYSPESLWEGDLFTGTLSVDPAVKNAYLTWVVMKIASEKKREFCLRSVEMTAFSERREVSQVRDFPQTLPDQQSKNKIPHLENPFIQDF